MKTIRRFFWFVPTIIWMVVMFQFSSQVGPQSASLSLKVTEKVARTLHETVLEDRDYDELVVILHPIVRKCAHMAEYAVLYVLLFLSFFFSMLATRSAALSIVIAFLYAVFDETHQAFVQGRSGSYLDVCVDMTGVLAAVCVILFVYSFWQSRHLTKEERRREQLESETEERVRQEIESETDERIRRARIEGARLEHERLRRQMEEGVRPGPGAEGERGSRIRGGNEGR